MASPSSRKLISWRKRIDWAITESRKKSFPPFIQLATVDCSQSEAPVPRCRTVVFRGFLDGSETASCESSNQQILKIITDARSEKVGQIRENPQVEVTWWFPGSNEQFRISGRAELHSFGGALITGGATSSSVSSHANTEAVRDQWRQLKDQAREQFYWDQPGVNFSGLGYSKDRKFDFELQENEAMDEDGKEENSKDSSDVQMGQTQQGEKNEPVMEIPPGGRDSSGTIVDPPETFLLLLVCPECVKYLRLGDNFATCEEFKDGKWTTARVNP